MMGRAFISERITALRTTIVAYEDALAAFASNGALQSYTIDTGQSRQTVMRAEISSMNNTINSLYNRLATLEARLYGGSITARPGY